MYRGGKLLISMLAVMMVSSLLLAILILPFPTYAGLSPSQPAGCVYTQCTFWYGQACNTYLCPQQREWVRYCRIVDPCFGYEGPWWREHRCDTCY